MQKVNFLIPDSNEYLDSEKIEKLSLEDHDFFINSQRAWIVQTYLHLKKLSSLIVCSDRLDADAINVLHCDEMLKYPYIENYFTVSIVADRRVHLGGDLTIAQNKDQVTTRKDHWIMHWPQANLVASLSTRGRSVFRIGFLGLEKNSIDLKKIFSDSKYNENIEIVFRGPGEWHDYSDLDAVVAVRDFISRNSQKPATKLVNAWRARVVFIGGKDSAYEQIGTPGHDYIKCLTKEELIYQVEQLIEQPELKKKIVSSGVISGAKYTDRCIEKQWLDFFEAVASVEFEKWKKQQALVRMAFRWHRQVSYLMMRAKRFMLLKAGKY